MSRSSAQVSLTSSAPHLRGFRHGRVRYRLAVGLISGVFLIAGCSEDEPELTTAELLNQLEGRQLSAAEVAQREQVAQTLCRLDDKVLVEIWSQLSAQQLEFQDFVFSRTCDSRSPLYAESTGRFAVNGE